MYAFLLTEAWGCRDFVLSTRIEQAFDATKDGRKQIHRLIGQNSHEDVVRHLAAECAASSMQRLLRVHSHRAIPDQRALLQLGGTAAFARTL